MIVGAVKNTTWKNQLVDSHEISFEGRNINDFMDVQLHAVFKMDKKNDKVMCGRKKSCGEQEYISILKDNYWLQYRIR